MITILDDWARDYNIPAEALASLKRRYTRNVPASIGTDQSEAAMQTRIRLEASKAGLRLFRNNVGALRTPEGRVVRYGLANESYRMNLAMKSSDLIGIRPVTITAQHIGHTLGQFVAREVKAAPWTYRDTSRERAQRNFIELIVSLGGDACFANGEGTI